jgi:hypothetical protein
MSFRVMTDMAAAVVPAGPPSCHRDVDAHELLDRQLLQLVGLGLRPATSTVAE